jgi:serine/threonine-protein kinase RsbW
MSANAGMWVTVRASADDAGVVRAIRAARAFATSCALAETTADRLCVVVEEWLSNVVEHGQPAPGSRLIMRIQRGAAGLILTLTDSGQPFDPRTTPAFEGPNPERGGGAGLELVRAWAKVADYRRDRGRNRVVLVVPGA